MLKALLIFFILIPIFFSQSQNQVINSPLTGELKKIFPALSRGYIDLNQNGEIDQNEDIDEVIAESTIKDGLIQGKEILDFIIKNYEFIPLDKLNRVAEILEETSGAIPELIALQYQSRINEAAIKKEELDALGLHLTPAARREAMDKMEKLINTMTMAYNKESRESETEFVQARDELFTMIERGYPLPETLNQEDSQLIVNIMIHTIIKEAQQNSDQVKASIKTLGRIGDPTAVDYLLELLARPELKKESIKALGEIGSSKSLNRLLAELDTEKDKQVKIEIIRSVGKIGGKESISRLTAILKPEGEEHSDQDIQIAALGAMVEISAQGHQDKTLQAIFDQYLAMPDPRARVLAIRGLASFKNPVVSNRLLTALNKEASEEVRIETIRALNSMDYKGTVPAFINLLRSKDTTAAVKIALLTALGNNSSGQQALPYILENLGAADSKVREAAGSALIILYDRFAAQVVGALSKTLLRSKDKTYLTEGTRVLARLNDKASLPFLIPLLSSPYPEVKKNVTWALYRIRSAANPRAVDELKRLVKSETETINVRINAVRALGAIRYDSPQLKIWETLLNVVKMREEKYSMLRFFALQALGDLGSAEPQVIATLLKVANRDSDSEIKKQAASVLKDLSISDPLAENTLIRLFKREKDIELRLRIIEALGDMFSPQTADIAPALLKAEIPVPLRKRALYALAQVGGEHELLIILDAAKDPALNLFVQGILEDSNEEALKKVINRRIKSENNQNILQVLENLQSGLEEGF